MLCNLTCVFQSAIPAPKDRTSLIQHHLGTRFCCRTDESYNISVCFPSAVFAEVSFVHIPSGRCLMSESEASRGVCEDTDPVPVKFRGTCLLSHLYMLMPSHLYKHHISIGILKVRIQYVCDSLIMYHPFSWQLFFETSASGNPPSCWCYLNAKRLRCYSLFLVRFLIWKCRPEK